MRMTQHFFISKRMLLMLCLWQLFLGDVASAAEWQWSIPDGDGRAYLWIPPDCQRVRAVVVGQHNMLEQGILEHAEFRGELQKLGIAELWYVPKFEMQFDFNKGAGEHFQRIMDALAEASGYVELKVAPVVPIGHSACATYPWNFAAWNPGRTLAVLSFHGDAPKTKLTGYSGPNVDWGDRTIENVPALMVMGEYEWWEDRLLPALAYMAKHPKAPIAFLADTGRGHFDFDDRTVKFLAMFVRKAAERRLPRDFPVSLEAPIPLTAIDPKDGWRIDCWHKDQSPPAAPAAPFDQYKGDPTRAFWCFDEEQAKLTESRYQESRGKLPQYIGFSQEGQATEKPKFLPGEDGMTFTLGTRFLEKIEDKNGKDGLPAGSPVSHASGGGEIVLSKIVGPGVVIGKDKVIARLDRSVYTADRRNNDLWLLASHPGDDRYKSASQPVMVRIPPNKTGALQTISFEAIPDQQAGLASLKLSAKSNAGLPVQYYVREGPAEIDGETLTFTSIPPRAKFPIKVTVVAWQWGRTIEPKVQTAAVVEQTFSIVQRPSDADRK
jgi:hypothetical protein